MPMKPAGTFGLSKMAPTPKPMKMSPNPFGPVKPARPVRKTAPKAGGPVMPPLADMDGDVGPMDAAMPAPSRSACPSAPKRARSWGSPMRPASVTPRDFDNLPPAAFERPGAGPVVLPGLPRFEPFGTGRLPPAERRGPPRRERLRDAAQRAGIPLS